MEKQLPQHIQAEQGLLGSLILDPNAFDLVCDTLTADDFYRDAHRTMYAAIVSLAARRIPADFISLSDELARTDKLDEVGGPSAIIDLVNDVPTSANAAYYAAIVARCAVQRRVIHAAGLIAAMAYHENAEDTLERAEQILFALHGNRSRTGFVPLSEVMQECLDDIDTQSKSDNALAGLSTGFSDLDDTLSGLQKTDLIILAARPGAGKSALAMSIAHNAAMKGKRIAVFSLEMGRKQLGMRMLAMKSKIGTQRLRSGWIGNDWDAVIDSGGSLSQLPIWINDAIGTPIASMRSQMRRLVAEHGIDLIIVDYLQLIEPSDDAHKRATREQEIGMISRNLKQMAREFNVPVLALAQLSRAVEQRQSKVPIMSDLRESGSIENDADVIMFIYRDDYYAKQEGRDSKAPNTADIYIAKHRNGPTGVVQLYFDETLTLFANLETRLDKEGK